MPAAYPRFYIGIGRATAIALSNAGWDVVITARRLDQLDETKSRCGETSSVLVLTGDISDERFVLEMFRQTVSKFGKAAAGGFR